MHELWLPLPEWEGIYEVSNLGQLKRVKSGRGVRAVGRLLKPQSSTGGYMHFHLRNGVRNCYFKAHLAVLSAFVGPRPDNFEVNHKDGNPKNNRLGNLEYCTSSENKLHSYRVLMRAKVCKKGMTNGNSKLSDDQVTEIRSRYSSGAFSQQSLANDFGVSQALISRIIRRVNWNHLTHRSPR